jgi:hypothetical protein
LAWVHRDCRVGGVHFLYVSSPKAFSMRDRPYTKTKLVCGVGRNDADYPVYRKENRRVVWTCPYYRVWSSMLKRCYSEAFLRGNPTYAGCSVVHEWLSLTAFRSWMEKQDWAGRELDKDLLNYGNKVYSPDTCCFVSSSLNTLLNEHSADRGDCPRGVSFHKPTRKYQAAFRRQWKRVYLGLFDTPTEAARAYTSAKSVYILEVADSTPDPKVAAALKNHVARIQASSEVPLAPPRETVQ